MSTPTNQERITQRFLAEASSWYEANRPASGGARTNVINAGLKMASIVRFGLPIPRERYVSKNGSQVKGLSGAAVKKILEQHGETRKYTSEGGRTSRGTLPKARDLVERWNSLDAEGVDIEALADTLEEFFVEKAQIDYFDRQRLAVVIDASKPVAHTVQDILTAAAERSDKPTGTVLQHLVGAKLELRFPSLDIGRDQANAGDAQTNRQGDFQLGTTAFHVTVSPMEKLMDRCAENVRHGYRPVILVPENRLAGARQMAEDNGLGEAVNVVEAETFIGTNIEELAEYSSDRIREGLARLVRRYNERIEDVEPDGSLRVDEPTWFFEVLNGQSS